MESAWEGLPEHIFMTRKKMRMAHRRVVLPALLTPVMSKFVRVDSGEKFRVKDLNLLKSVNSGVTLRVEEL